MHHATRTSVALGAAAVAVLATAPAATADREFHTQGFALEAVGDHPLRSGHIIDIHTEGLRNYAHERYQLRGAMPGTTYQVVLRIFADPGCTTELFPVPTDVLTTNRAGNANGRADFDVATVQAVGLQPGLYGITWDVRVGDQTGATVLSTGCEAVILD
jgi:hypothetical protein